MVIAMNKLSKNTVPFPVPDNELERLKDILAYKLEDDCVMENLDQICVLARSLFDVPIASAILIGHDRMTFLGRSGGMDATSVPRKDVYSNYTILSDDVHVIEDTLQDERFKHNPFAQGPEGLRFYAAAPLYVRKGVRVGAFGILDHKPRGFSEENKMRLRALADLANKELQRRQVLMDLKRQRDLWSQTARMTKVGSWSFDSRTQVITSCPNTYDILEVDPERGEPGKQMMEYVIETLSSKLDADFAALVSRGAPLDREIEVITAKGNRRWGRLYGRAEKLHDRITHIAGSLQDVSETHETASKISRLAFTDSLTNLPNRTYFHKQLQQMGEAADTDIRPGSLLLLDIDHFKEVNDTFGSGAGDIVLKTVTRRLNAMFGKTCRVFRNGGDEFAVILSSELEAENTDLITDGLMQVLRKPITLHGQNIHITASVGLALKKQHSTDMDQLLKDASLALTTAKKEGRNQLVTFRPEMRQEQIQTKRLLDDIRLGLASGMFKPHYQPIVDISTNTISGFEALMRWHHPERGVLTPGAFGVAFDDPELALSLSDVALEHALERIALWRAADVTFGSIAVNLSCFQFQSGDLVANIQEKLSRWDVPPECLTLEVTENVYMGRRASQVASTIRKIHSMGVQIALDDFGTGYASLMSLNKFPIDRLKIEKSFVQDRNGGAVVQAIMTLGSRLGMKVVAEGVEDASQLATLYAMGCDQIQGYYFAKPMPPQNVPEYVRKFANNGDTENYAA